MIRTILVTAFLTLPTMALAQSACQDKHQAQSCGEGSQWNAEKGTCEQIVSS
jgi:hypothetical protein